MSQAWLVQCWLTQKEVCEVWHILCDQYVMQRGLEFETNLALEKLAYEGEGQSEACYTRMNFFLNILLYTKDGSFHQFKTIDNNWNFVKLEAREINHPHKRYCTIFVRQR